jgi:hypothetical protein
MTNFEKYKDDLMKIEGDFGFSKTKQKIGVCYCADDNIETVECEDCLFNELPTCCYESEKIKWLYKEADEPVLTNDELELIKSISKVVEKEIKYMARDNLNNMRFFETKPKINVLRNYYSLNECSIFIEVMNGDIFHGIQHKDGLYDIENKCFIKE